MRKHLDPAPLEDVSLFELSGWHSAGEFSRAQDAAPVDGAGRHRHDRKRATGLDGLRGGRRRTRGHHALAG